MDDMDEKRMEARIDKLAERAVVIAEQFAANPDPQLPREIQEITKVLRMYAAAKRQR